MIDLKLVKKYFHIDTPCSLIGYVKIQKWLASTVKNINRKRKVSEKNKFENECILNFLFIFSAQLVNILVFYHVKLQNKNINLTILLKKSAPGKIFSYHGTSQSSGYGGTLPHCGT